MNGHLEKKPGMNEQVTTNGQIPVASKEKKKPNIVQRVANKIVWFFETGFER